MYGSVNGNYPHVISFYDFAHQINPLSYATNYVILGPGRSISYLMAICVEGRIFNLLRKGVCANTDTYVISV